MSGENFDLGNDSKILAIKAPQDSVGGPYVVVYKNLEERWAIVAMDWDEEPRLGIRWFWLTSGCPLSNHQPIWFVVPPSLSKNLLSGLPLDHMFSGKLDDYLTGKITGTELKTSVAGAKADK